MRGSAATAHIRVGATHASPLPSSGSLSPPRERAGMRGSAATGPYPRRGDACVALAFVRLPLPTEREGWDEGIRRHEPISA